MKQQISRILVVAMLGLSAVVVSSAYSSYRGRPMPRHLVEDVHLVRESRQAEPHHPRHRYPAQSPYHQPRVQPTAAIERQASFEDGSFAPEPHESRNRFQRGSHDHHEHVDYGAHTGHKGAFGWYADFPVKSKD